MSIMNRQSRYEASIAWLALMGALLSFGCTHYTDYSAFISEPRPLVTLTEYRMAPPDTIQIASKRVREFNGYRETISPDGKITVPLIGSIFVAGRTCEEVAQNLEELARDFYEDADVTMRVIGYRSKKIYVFGEAGAVGPYVYNGANTVLETLAKAQPSRLADASRIQILRPNKDGDLIRRMTIDLDKMVKEGDIALDAVLEEGDIIYIPPNPLAAVGLVFQQLLLPIQPMVSTVQGPADFDEAGRSEVYGGNRTN